MLTVIKGQSWEFPPSTTLLNLATFFPFPLQATSKISGTTLSMIQVSRGEKYTCTCHAPWQFFWDNLVYLQQCHLEIYNKYVYVAGKIHSQVESEFNLC